MNLQHILIDDNNPAHRELSIYRIGSINRIYLQDKTYKTYSTIKIDAHDYAAFFHYGITESLNTLPFLSESGNGLDSWDEAFLHNSSIVSMNKIISECRTTINPEKNDIILLGWQNQPIGIAYQRKIESKRFLDFLDTLEQFVSESAVRGYDLEFIL
ncbi:MAG: hypothetical protein WCK32_09725 [Chlorobiaceae bacterium]